MNENIEDITLVNKFFLLKLTQWYEEANVSHLWRVTSSDFVNGC